MGIYVSYKCKGCSREFILIESEMISAIGQGKYISCSYCGCKKVKATKATDDLREVTKARSYKRIHGRIREIK